MRGFLFGLAMLLGGVARAAQPAWMALEPAQPTMLASGHSVNLAWTNSIDTPNTFVFKLSGVCPQTLTGFTQLNATAITTGAYTDSAVTPGQYCYYVEAQLNGVFSAPSNTVNPTVPTAPPTGLTVVSVQ